MMFWRVDLLLFIDSTNRGTFSNSRVQSMKAIKQAFFFSSLVINRLFFVQILN